MTRAFLLLGLLLAACSSDDTLVGTPESADGGSSSNGTLCAETAVDPTSCTTVSGKEYSLLQNGGSGGTFTISGGSKAEVVVNSGNATVICAAGATCEVVLNGGSASVQCATGAKCELQCSGGSGTLACTTAADCELETSSNGRCIKS